MRTGRILQDGTYTVTNVAQSKRKSPFTATIQSGDNRPPQTERAKANKA